MSNPKLDRIRATRRGLRGRSHVERDHTDGRGTPENQMPPAGK